MIDFAAQRKNMLESQVRPSDVTDRRILRAIEAVPRELFVSAAFRSLAYADVDLPLDTAGGERREMLAPRVFAKLVHLAAISATDHVLDVGCATGYSAAVLAAVASSVVALDCDSGLTAKATAAMRDLGIESVSVVTGALAAGHVAEAPYDAIIVEGMILRGPDDLLPQLKDGGRLVALMPAGGVGRATVWQRFGDRFALSTKFDASGPLMPGFEAERGFVF